MTSLQNDQPQDQPEKKKRPHKARVRSRGEGSVFERKGGSVRRKKPWVAQITIDGKPKTLGYFKTEAEAIAARNKALRDREQGTWVESSKQTLGEYLDYWLEHVHKPTLKAATYRNYRSALNSRIIPALGHLQTQKLTVRHIQMFYSDLQGLSAPRVRYLHAILHGAMEHAVREGLVARNVCHGVRLPRLEDQERQVLSMEQAAQLWGATQDSEMRMILILALTTAMREGEMLALKWQDVDLKARKIHVRRNLVVLKGGKLVEMEPKTIHSKRRIPLPSFVVDALEKYQTGFLTQRGKSQYCSALPHIWHAGESHRVPNWSGKKSS
ncbi:MAG TPA: site-specific integrase [Ktedonobacteraceae bacterium]|nr:site-specific integrase [Ktedonobacteraceae bacterium]